MPSSRASTAAISAGESALAAIVGIDRNVVMRKVAGPDARRRLAAAERNRYGDLILFHHTLSVHLGVRQRAPTPIDHGHVVETKRYTRGIEIGRRGIADCADDAAQVRIRRKERGFEERRMRDAERVLPALGRVAAALDGDRDELGRALPVANDRLRKLGRHFGERAPYGADARVL